MVGMADVLCGITTIHCSSDTAIRLASKMAGDEAAKDPNIVSDAMGELCNMVAGNFKAKITSLADHCMLSVRTVITGENYALQSAEPSESLQVALLFESSPIQISLIAQS
jgi:chemotaxis protein CheX